MSENYYVPKKYRLYQYEDQCEPFIGDDGKYHFLYKIINIINNKYYIGIHTTNDILDGYSGSGKILNMSIRKYGSQSFKKYILKYFKSREELIKAESEYVTIKEVNDPLCYNLVCGGIVKVDSENSLSKIQAGSFYIYNETINKRIRIHEDQLELYLSNGWKKGYGPVSDAVKNSGTKGKKLIHNDIGEIKWVSKNDLDFFLNMGWILGGSQGSNKNKIYIHKDRDDREWPDRKMIYPKDLKKWIKNGWVEGYGESSDRLKIGTITGKIYVTKNGSTKTINPEDLNKYLENGWMRGVVGFEHHRSLVGRKRMYNPNNNESKFIIPEEQQKYIDMGWKFGMGYRQKNKNKQCFIFKNDVFLKINIEFLDQYLKDGWIKRGPAKGSIQIHKDGKNKMIFQQDLQNYLDNGWKIGMKPKKHS